MTHANTFETTDGNFENDVLKATTPVLVDFWASWCGPCRALSPVIDELADEYKGKLKVFKVNTDENPNTPSRYGVRGIPTIIVFKDGQIVDQSVGVVAKVNLQAMINKAFG
ncbi:MAG: thioredoxin [Deltaproteobacteria bacterium]|nr:thioredoxin [Deltaproteobacteria bacterium]